MPETGNFSNWKISINFSLDRVIFVLQSKTKHQGGNDLFISVEYSTIYWVPTRGCCWNIDTVVVWNTIRWRAYKHKNILNHWNPLCSIGTVIGTVLHSNWIIYRINLFPYTCKCVRAWAKCQKRGNWERKIGKKREKPNGCKNRMNVAVKYATRHTNTMIYAIHPH